MTIEIKVPIVINLLQTFSESEIGGFTHFVNCRHFNTDRYVVLLLEELKLKFLAKIIFDKTSRLDLFKTLFPDRKVVKGLLSATDKSLLNAKLAFLNKLAKQFLCIEKLKERPACESELLQECLLERKQFKMLQRKINVDTKALVSKKAKGESDYRFAYQTEHAQLYYYHQKGMLLKVDNLDKLNNELDKSYLINKLYLHVTMLSLAAVSPKKKFDYKSMEGISLLLEIYNKHPLVKTYQKAIALIKADDIQHYDDLLKLLDENEVYIPINILNDLYVVASNFCSQQIRLGNLIYNEILFKLYKLMDHKNLILEKGMMPMQQLKNVIKLCCVMGEYDWGKSFIAKHRKHINAVYRESVCQLNYGLIAFYQKQYKTAIDHFIHVGKINPVYEISCRILLLKSYYEFDQDYDEGTLRLFRTTEQFIQNQKTISSTYKSGFKNFTTALLNIYSYRHFSSKKSLESIQNKLDKMKLVSDKAWLLEKIQELRVMKRRR